MDEMKNMNMVKFADVSGINLPFVLYIPDGINEKSNLRRKR